MRHLAIPAGLLSLFLLGGCERSVAEPERIIVLKIEGTVRSENTGAAIPGATVELIHSSTFFIKDGVPVVAVVADSQGRYAIKDKVSVATPSGPSIGFGCSSCLNMAVRASAAGYETSNVEDPLFQIGYSEVRRQIDILLKPLDR